MERRLLTIAIFCFLFELTIYFGDMFGISIPFWSDHRPKVIGLQIGSIEWTRQNVRRQNFGSNIWEDSEPSDRLFANDSILTLKGSSARLILERDIALELHENTLVTLDSFSESPDQPFRLRFSRGDLRAHNTKRNLELNAGEWTVAVEQGADLSLRETIDGRLEVEVSEGSAKLTHAGEAETQILHKDQLAQLNKGGLADVSTSTPELSWENFPLLRVYSHSFPTQVGLKWKGSAEQIKIQSSNVETTLTNVAKDQQELNRTFTPGTYHLTLRAGTKQSRSMMLQVLSAPEIIYLFPLPRDRVKYESAIRFSWLSETTAKTFRLELSTDSDFKNIVSHVNSKITHAELVAPSFPEMFWRVIGVDENGFEIPERYNYPLFADPDPFSAPHLRSPSSALQDESASTIHPRRFHWLNLLSYLFCQAGAAEAMPPVIFNWEPISGADHYIIEISETTQFDKPLIIAKVSTHFYAWTNFEKKVYYYRVAGGSQQGRQGLFSQPEPIDLRNWPPPKSSKRIKKERTMAQATPLPVPENIQKAVEPITSTPEKVTSYKTAIWWRALFSDGQFETNDFAKSTFSGLQPMGLGLSINIDSDLIRATYQRKALKPKNSSQLPFQEPVNLDDISLTYSHSLANETLALGLGAHRWSTLERDGSENLKSVQMLGFGPHFLWQILKTSSLLTFEMEFTTAGDRSLLSMDLIYKKEFYETLFFGIDTAYLSYLGKTKGHETQFGVSLGRSF